MYKSQEAQLNFIELTPPQYGKIHNPPLTGAAVINRCKQGSIKNCYQTAGGRWKILIQKGETANREDFEKLRQENADLRAAINSMVQIATQV